MRPTRAPQWLFLVTLVTPSLVRGQTPEPPLVFRSRVEAVYVDVFVARSGQPVPGLTAADFELRDNRVPQKLELLSAESRPILAILVFDSSSSIDGEKLSALRSAGEAFLGGLRAADQAALVAFSEQINWLAQPTTDKVAVREALGSLRPEGATSVFDALYAAVTLSDQSLRPLIVLFTDGEDNGSWLGDREIKAVVERSNTLVHVVGWRPRTDNRRGSSSLMDLASGPHGVYRGSVGGVPDEATGPGLLDDVRVEGERHLREIAEASGGRFWAADSPARLQMAFTAVADAMRQRYVLRYEPSGVKREGWHRIDVRLKAGKGEVNVRRGYWVAR